MHGEYNVKLHTNLQIAFRIPHLDGLRFDSLPRDIVLITDTYIRVFFSDQGQP
jgi:hypothetical protein